MPHAILGRLLDNGGNQYSDGIEVVILNMEQQIKYLYVAVECRNRFVLVVKVVDVLNVKSKTPFEICFIPEKRIYA